LNGVGRFADASLLVADGDYNGVSDFLSHLPPFYVD
jgi:hypothetical protein